MPLNPKKPDVPASWLQPYRAGQTKKLEAKIRSLPSGEEAIEFQRQRRKYYAEFWTYNQAVHIAWRETEEKYGLSSIALPETPAPAPAAVPPRPLSSAALRVPELVPGEPGEPDPPPSGLTEAGETAPPAPDIKGLDLHRDVLWVYQNLGRRGIRQSDAPSHGAWNLFLYAKDYRTRFFENFLPRASRVLSELDEDVEVAEAKSVEEIRRILAQTIEAARKAARRDEL